MTSLMRSLLSGAFACTLLAGTASADIIVFDEPPFPANPDENVLLTTDVAAVTVTGTTNQTNSTVIFTGNETLVAPPNGQARIEAVDGGVTFPTGDWECG